jgi:hypothetical protein
LPFSIVLYSVFIIKFGCSFWPMLMMLI